MKLSEAWAEIKRLGNVNQLSPKQVYSIISDYGVFKEMSRIQIITKIALQNGLWDIIKASTCSTSEIERLRNKLQFYGFSDDIIHILFVECNIVDESHKDYITEHSYSKHIVTKNTDTSTSHISDYNPLKNKSSNSDIEVYLNSILEIDQVSFQRHGLILQRISPIEWKKGAGLYCDKFGACFSFEIIGNTKFGGGVEVEVYDLNGFLRSIHFLSSIFIQGKYSIVNETKIVDLYLLPQYISKIVFHVDTDFVHMGNAFYGENKSIFRYEGCVENDTETFDILYTQILYANGLQEDNVSVFFRYKIKKRPPKNLRVGDKNLYIVLFDINECIRQKMSLFDSMSYYRIISTGDNNEEHCAFSGHTVGFQRTTLKMPFDEIGKIVFIEE